jgi:hypothetical protein
MRSKKKLCQAANNLVQWASNYCQKCLVIRSSQTQIINFKAT